MGNPLVEILGRDQVFPPVLYGPDGEALARDQAIISVVEPAEPPTCTWDGLIELYRRLDPKYHAQIRTRPR